MAGKLRAMTEYLGLSEAERRYDDEYDDTYTTDESHEYADSGYDETAHIEQEREAAPVTQLHKNAPAGAPAAGGPISRITTIHPRTYNEAKEIGENFRGRVPVIMNLSDMDDNDAKRLVDFAAGLVFGLHGTIERVTAKVFLLSPSGVEVATTGADAARTPRGLFNQS
ncbi:cell division protein SepF [Allobranchiibius sp. GilTou73]|uniref:cell division protein SepF n=1 Tax=Allobranchiibius sp. GilTou73 TaxID=2904523 RepID=UPI001F17ABB2|nr:cell division protein SepF [Allobranchiibius sp. GilTou73]UIJ33545.1 cell division protein SepF [Allobranchiibius sp. GilTou73]